MSDQPRPTGTEQANVRWLRGLRDLAQNWVRSESLFNQDQTQTVAYTDLIFAFGLARLATDGMSKELLGRATAALADKDEAHALLLEAFTYRIAQVMEGKPHAGPLPDHLVESIETIDFLLRYVVDRLRKHSRILEPDQQINPYRHWGARINDLERALADLPCLNDGEEIVRRVEHSLRDLETHRKGNELRLRVLRAGLNAAARVNADFGRRLLDQVRTTCEAQPEPAELGEIQEQAFLLERALFIANYFKLREWIAPLVACLRRLLAAAAPRTFLILGCKHTVMAVLSPSFGQCVQSLQRAGERGELGHLLTEATGLILQRRELAGLDPEQLSDDPDELGPLVHVASGMLSLGQLRETGVILTATRMRLFQDEQPGKARRRGRASVRAVIAADYAKALGHAPVEEAKGRLEELLRSLKGIDDTYTTRSHYSVAQLDVVEAVVLSAVGVLTQPDEPLTVTT
jgi:hypothetical protein